MNDPIELLKEIQRLLELKGENPFKIRAFEKAAHALAGRDDLKERAQKGTLREIPGVGKGIEEVLVNYLLHQKTPVLDDLNQALPPGLVEITQIPGVGPKKAAVLIETLGIQSVGELEYACKENRLLKLKGFGPKIQKKIMEGISLKASYQGFFKLSEAWDFAELFSEKFIKNFPGILFSETGAFRRKVEVLQSLDFLVGLAQKGQEGKDDSLKIAEVKKWTSQMVEQEGVRFPVHVFFINPQSFAYELARTTGTPEHWIALGSPHVCQGSSELKFYEDQKLPWIPPEARETGEEVALAKAGKLKRLIPSEGGIRGVFHNHTVRSDGSGTLEEMVAGAEKLGFEYIGISDHSQTAFYAQGLKEDVLEEQYREIQTVQALHPNIRIFWGIESDILADGSLDYDSKVLKKFDFVIASIHSRFNMDRDTMTQRILTAIRNPYTRFLGHPTGRLILGRKGYDLDMEAVILEASRNDVAVELNSNPDRLDLDWRWGPQMRKHHTLTSINPDAHEVAGLEHFRYGIAMARKALLPMDQIINTKSVNEVEKWLKRK